MAEREIKLFLPEQVKADTSSFRMGLMEEEVKEINEKFPLEENSVNIQLAYANETDEGLEVSFYIRSTMKNNINFEIIPLELIKDGQVVGSQVFNLSAIGNVPAYSAVPYTVEFDKKSLKTDDFSDLKVVFSQANALKALKTLDLDISNIPEQLQYKYKKQLEEYSKSLPRVRKDSIDLHVYTVSFDEDKNLDVVMLIRNGYDKEIKIEKFPITIYDKNNTVIYTGEYYSEEGIVISASTSKLITITFDEVFLLNNEGDLSEFRVEFK
ncbi:SLAP domain-containing protein [Clostridium oryzae]|uniref:SLAP domain-containing protein n=1 Tax=Clostridium oryzae TaxID=1450648 RepID=A0A1V4IZ81_9CLOT|nr:SLAP domain-containing protein [Clostridium oryzae]OPJ65084.1 hypothetical protein CLORY_00840 [Clostridium oryzae]